MFCLRLWGTFNMGYNPLDHTFCVVMAGGKGERFWPLSTDQAPKPFLKLMDEKTMIQLTVERAMRIVPRERLFVVLGQNHLDVAKEQLPDLAETNFIVEPEGKDTAPCIGLAALTLMGIDEKAIMITLPADHYVPDVDDFTATILDGVKCAATGDYLVTIGIKPIRPETGYGYINAFEEYNIPGVTCYKVNRIVEKPDMERARAYLEEGNYYWNGGIFIWQARVILKGIEQHMPELYRELTRIKALLAAGDSPAIGEVYRGIQRKSIDYGLMEKAANVLMVPSGFRWDDVGTWTSLLRVLKLDGEGNYRAGNALCVDTRDCVVYGDGIFVGTIGVSDLVIVASKHGVLVCHGDKAQEVREIVKRLDQEK
ncbi:MAG: mannose-1-phosphate guanylyltransferase [Syntrophus sp. (in: bacteria)]|nr:mannose-1-phosphate guanylyltransferase [Syntrophus sp. (in: bacteria)]